VPVAIRQLIRDVSLANAPHGSMALLKLGIAIGQTSVANGMDRPCSRP
jgi:hypothetical protein